MSPGGTATGDTITAEGSEVVFAQGTASAETVTGGGSQIVSVGGTALSRTLSGGALNVLQGGAIESARVSGGGIVSVFGGNARDTVVASGGGLLCLHRRVGHCIHDREWRRPHAAQRRHAVRQHHAMQILDNGVPIARVLANLYRTDLAAVGFGCGRHGFDVAIPGGLAPLVRHVIQVCSETDGSELPGSPVAIEPSDAFDAALEQAIRRAVASIVAGAGRRQARDFLLAQAATLAPAAGDSRSVAS